MHRYAHGFRAYKRTRPGLTGMRQVDRGSDTSYAARFKFDTYYVLHHSALLDIKILVRTVRVVLQSNVSC